MANNYPSTSSNSIPMPTPPANSSLKTSNRIPFSFDFRVDICPTNHLPNAETNSNEVTPPGKSTCDLGCHERCVHGCKERMISSIIEEGTAAVS